MTVSVIMPVYNGARFIGEALESVLCQGDAIAEIIVVDDGSRDRSAEGATSYDKGEVIQQENAGIGPARNSGIALATGEFLAFLDADDIWESDKTGRQLQAMKTHGDWEGVFGRVEQFHNADYTPPTSLVTEQDHFTIAGSLLIKREAFDRAGPFSSDHRVGEFIEWYARALDADVQFGRIDEPVLRRRIHGDNTTIREQESRSGYLNMVRATIARRRAQKAG